MQKTISEFLSNEYKEFALYSIENRAIPSVIDGLKPTHKKIIHIASKIWKTGNEKTLKVFQLSGKVASECYYHHGDMSLSNAIINLAQSFKNNAPLLEEDGQFGSLRSPEAGAPRYIGTKLSKYYNLIYKDTELLNYREEEGEKIEPYFFLPIIPMILVNGSQGIAVGFASNILNRDIKDLIKLCQKVISGKKCELIKPSLNNFKGEWIQDNDNPLKWIIRGKFERINTKTIHISELPPSLTYEKYEQHLEKLVEDKIIVEYDDNCKDDINYLIKFKRNELKTITDEEIIKILKLEEKQTENLTTLDENGKIKIFKSVNEIIEYFIEFILKYYEKRKEFCIEKLKKESNILKNKALFIKLILDGKIIVNNKEKVNIIKQIEKNKIQKVDDSYDYLLRMPIYSLTKEYYEKLKEELTKKENDIIEISKVSHKDMYINDLKNLLSSL
jgi:DNA topoisomerase-2